MMWDRGNASNLRQKMLVIPKAGIYEFKLFIKQQF